MNTNNSNFINGYIKLQYDIYKVYEGGPDQIVKTFNVSLILIPPLNSEEDMTRTKIIGINKGFDNTSPSQIQDVLCLERESVKVINGKYTFNNTDTYTNDMYGINEGKYVLKNIPIEHPV